jgi:hypothetical protein
VITRINVPNDAFDMFGRLIGDIFFRNGGKTISIGQLAAQHGWALPAYYNSMNPDEILALHTLFEQARGKGSGIWPHFDKVVGQLNLLKFRDGGAFNKKEEQADRGPFAVPKIFRRQLRYSVLQQNNLAPKTFNDYLAGKTAQGANKERHQGRVDHPRRNSRQPDDEETHKATSRFARGSDGRGKSLPKRRRSEPAGRRCVL